jgi:TonB family protein
MIVHNVLVWTLQIALVVVVAALSAAVLHLRAPVARLFYWRVALAASLLLPLVRPWKPQPIVGDVSVSTVLSATQTQPASHHLPSPGEALLWLVAAGIAMRLVWLGTGFWRLGRYRRHSRPFGRRNGATLLLSDDVTSPVTFGAIRPVVLLPARFPEFPPAVREAILCHELLHVRRRDWLYMVAEELVRAAFWFHPGVWWMLGEIGLAREQEVDRQVVASTRTREEYVDALLAIASAGAQLDLAPAPLFLRRQHLKRRVVSILKEVRMSKTRLVSSLAAALCVLVAACWLVSVTFPLSAAPEAVADSPGVQVDIGSAALLHRTAVVYPEAVREQGVEGTVVLQAELDAKGNVTDAQVLAGPQELRKAALSSVLNWHFVADNSGPTRQISITFAPGYAQAPAKPSTPAAAIAQAPITVRSINIAGLSDQARSDLLSRLPVHEGDMVSAAQMAQITAAAKEFDSHLMVVMGRNAAGEGILMISTPDAAPSTGPSRIRLGGNVQSAKLINQPRPSYPADAKQARIQGKVELHAIIAKDGTIESLTVISGHPLLAAAAVDAVKQWVYQPTLLNGQPVEVETQIDVNFTLSQ